MDPMYRPTLLRVIAAAFAALLLVFLLGGVTEALAGNELAQMVRKTILIGSTLSVAAWVAGWRSARSIQGP